MENFLLEKNNLGCTDVVIFIHNINLRGGTEIMALNLMKAMNSSDLNCRILSLVPYNGNDENILSFHQSVIKQYQQIAASPICKLFAPQRHLSMLKNLLSRVSETIQPKLLINFTYDLLPATPENNGKTQMCGIFHWSVYGYEQSIIKQIRHKPFFLRYISSALFAYNTREIHHSLLRLDKLIVLTHAGEKEVLGLIPRICTERIHVIPNFIPYDKPCPKISTLNNKIALFVGRLSTEKGCYRLLDIWEEISHENPDWHLNIYGEGNERMGMECIIKQKKLPNIHFCGFQKNISNIYENADILLCTSDSEGFGLVLVEAMYYGVIPFSFDCPVSPRELIGNAGVLVKCYDCQEYARLVNNLIASPDRMKQLQLNAILQAMKFYKSTIIEQWRRLIN